MARFYGIIGFGETVETAPGVWQEVVVEHEYYGDLLRNTRTRVQEGEKLNDNISVGNSISIVADEYAYEHFHAMLYVSWAGTLWSVPDIEVQRPRLILTLGGVYNGPTTKTVVTPGATGSDAG